jgi:hypothetical protein
MDTIVILFIVIFGALALGLIYDHFGDKNE